MPKLSDTMEEGKIIRWLKHPGDAVHHGDALAEVETDKADMVMESFDEGVMDEIRLKEGESARVGAVIAILRGTGDKPADSNDRAMARNDSAAKAATPSGDGGATEEISGDDGATESAEAKPATQAVPLRPVRRKRAAAPSEESMPFAQDEPDGGAFPRSANLIQPLPEVHPALSAHPSAAPTAIAAPPLRAVTPLAPHETTPATTEGGGKFRASPLARRAAEEAGIDLAQVQGSGPEGRITKRDIDTFLRDQQLFKFRRLIAPREGLPGTREELSKMRKTIANRMAQSKREIPHFYVTVEVDMEEAVKLKNSLEATELFEEDISYNDIIIKATTLGLTRYTRMNASFEDDGVIIFPNINIGMAVAVEDGLIVPVIHDCERLSLPEIAAAAHRLVTKAARGGFTSDDLSGATFTISNMGMLGVEHFAAVIVPPQAAILAVSAIKDRPVVRNGQLGVGKTMMMTVACDHRIIDGVIGARFLNEIKRFLENPASLLV